MSRTLHCEGCGEAAVIYAESTTGLAGGPTIYLCGPCSSLGANVVVGIKDGDADSVALALLRIHAKLTRIHATRWEP